MRFVPVKSPEQQAELAVHRIRRRLMGQRTALINQLRGLLAEYGVVLPQGASHVPSKLPALLEDCSESLPPLAVELFRDLYEELVQLEQRIDAHERRVELSKRGDVYLRTLLVHGAGSAMRHTPKRNDPKSRWVEQLRRRRGESIAAVALAAKHARILWALMVRGESSSPSASHIVEPQPSI